MSKNIWKSLKSFLGMSLLAGSLMLPLRSNAEGQLELWNSSSSPGIRDNYLLFVQDNPDSDYMPEFSPSMEVYYENGTQHSTAGVSLSTNKLYNCPLAGQGLIDNGSSNAIAFKLVNEFPSNTLCTASVQTEGGFSTNINDVIAYTKSHTNAQGFAIINLPNTSNASDRVYGTVTMRFAPLYNLKVTSAHGTPNPGTTNNVPHGTVVTQSIESVVNGGAGTRYINKGSSLRSN